MFEEGFAKENVFHNKKMLFLCYASGKGTIYLIILHTLNITSENQITLDNVLLMLEERLFITSENVPCSLGKLLGRMIS